MARQATNSDVFNAVAEPRRRQILEVLAPGERSVGDLATILCLTQPQASKHLKVLKDVGLVGVRGAGKQRIYCLNGGALRPLHEWTLKFEQFWDESFDRLDELLIELQEKEPTE